MTTADTQGDTLSLNARSPGHHTGVLTTAAAWEIIRACEQWNTSQTSIAFAMRGERTSEDDIHDERRRTLAEAWRTVRVSE